MEIWNRDELYSEVWETPLVKLAVKYGISGVALGKVCRKLQIPLPGRGHWAKKEFGKADPQIPLPEAKNLPVLYRVRGKADPEAETVSHEINPEDPELVRIASVEQKDFHSYLESNRHALIARATKTLSRAPVDERGILISKGGDCVVDVRVSKKSLERALCIMNAIIGALESEGFTVTLDPKTRRTETKIFGQQVPFAIIEKATVTNRREIKEYSWTRTINEYRPTGVLEFKCGEYGYGWKKTVSDGKFQRLEKLLTHCVVKMMRFARDSRLRDEKFLRQQQESRKRELEREELARQISEERKKVEELDFWVTNWVRADQIRCFIVALEKVWSADGHDLPPDTPKAQRIAWMRQQADRLDPMLPSPPSILDRENELRRF